MKKSVLSFVKHMEVLSHLGLLKYIDYNKKDLFEQYKYILMLQQQQDFIDCEGLTLLCPPGVYHPHETSSSRFFIKGLIKQSFKENPSILEIGTGTGIILLKMASFLGTGKYLGTDINDVAVKAAKFNANYNQLSAQFIESDLFEAVTDFDFQTVLFSPPFMAKFEDNFLNDTALSDREGNILARFIDDVQTKFKQGTDVYFTISNLGDVSALHDIRDRLKTVATEVFTNGMMRSLLHMQL